MGTIADSPLGKAAHYVETYDAALLYPVERAPQRKDIGLRGTLPFSGADRWTAWELSWLDIAGKPQVAVATFDVPCESPRIVESKSVKLYLAALNGTRFADADTVGKVIARDLSVATGSTVDVRLLAPDAVPPRGALEGEPIDDRPLAVVAGAPDASLLRATGETGSRAFTTRLFRSVCPVTGQPDYADVQVRVEGSGVDPASLLAYLVAYRHHPGFHEHCVERIFVDVSRACGPAGLAVVARFTRRGGVDINPWRSSIPGFLPQDAPTARQ